jgi:nitroreductase
VFGIGRVGDNAAAWRRQRPSDASRQSFVASVLGGDPVKRVVAGGVVLVALLALSALVEAQPAGQQGLAQPPAPRIIKLSEPGKTRGLPVMEALSMRASVREWSDRDLSPQDLSDLLWAANGINRPDKRRTAASAMNAQDVDIYVFRMDGVYLYDAASHALVPIVEGDQRSQIGMTAGGGPGGPGRAGGPGAPGAAGARGGPGAPPAGMPALPPSAQAGRGPAGPQSTPPVQLVLVSDISRFRAGSPELKLEWAAIDTGIVSQNIALFCAGTGLGTRPRASIAKDRLKVLLKLKDTQYPLLEHPVGYRK